jgi:hypothetical protein
MCVITGWNQESSQVVSIPAPLKQDQQARAMRETNLRNEKVLK